MPSNAVSSDPAVVIDHTAYPHIIASILDHAECDVLHAFRATSRHYLSLIEDLLVPRQTIVQATRAALRGPPHSALPNLKSPLTSFLDADLPHLRRRFERVGALELHGETIDAAHLADILALLPNATVRIRNAGTLRERVSTLAAFLYLDHQLPCLLPVSPATRLVVNTHASSGARASDLLDLLPKARGDLPLELVLNFAAWETPPWLGSGLGQARTARMLSARESALLTRYIAWALERCEVTLVEFGRVWAWADPAEGFGAGERHSAGMSVDALFAHRHPRAKREGLHVLSLDEYRKRVGDPFEAEAGW